MFAPKMTKAQAKAPDGLTRPSTRQPSTPVAQPVRGGVLERARMLQGTIGNQARLGLLKERLSSRPATDPADRAAPSRLAAAPLPGAIQTKLDVGQVNDPLEQEADQVADQVMRTPDPEPSMAIAPLRIDRKCSACEEEEKRTVRTKSAAAARVVGAAPAIVHEVLRSPGQALDTRARAFLEPRFRRGFGAVRVHADPLANQSAQSIGALAYAAGHHIAFAAGRYAPARPDGLKLIAHELAHVLQQDGVGRQLQRQPVAQAQTKPAQTQDYRNYVQDAITYLNGSADFFGDPLARINQARFDQLINNWYATITEQDNIIDTQLGSERALTDALHAAYIRAIRALIGRAVAVLGKTEPELYRVNSGRIPIWAWQAPHHMEPGITTPIAEGRTVDPLTGNAQFTIGAFDVTILPDTRDGNLATPGETRVSVHTPGAPAFQWSGGAGGRTVTGFDAVARPAVEIQTVFGPGVSPGASSGYGRGTTPEDVAGGRVNPRSTRLGFHEGSHGLAFIEFLAANPAPTFAGSVGMGEAAFKAAQQAFLEAWKTYAARLTDYSARTVDCVGLTKEQFEQSNPPQQGLRFRCPH